MKINNAPVAKVAGHSPLCRLANDFQTPLGVIISAGEVLENYFDRLTPERRRLALEDILTAARQMNDSIGSLITSMNRKSGSKSMNKSRMVRERI